ncbi:hypothetical protein CLOAM1583 [Candidatus Cloacimonas acidaminovorans str. Evry]|uniref:Uncharacterized protein n=1 Tax=Cloacimonas acidaminovorans (strain Evry) TaxID=459349 RepID=B0VFY0_CLOAI|nr:hypothetical protein CLOAM1583 [Candidatus Cloacimonas acidaminovorans str. Evry]
MRNSILAKFNSVQDTIFLDTIIYFGYKEKNPYRQGDQDEKVFVFSINLIACYFVGTGRLW